MNLDGRMRSDSGFSMMEMLVALLILVPIMAAAVSLFSTGANQQATEQSNVDAVQEARAGLDLMATELAQAGSHRDVCTATTGAVSATGSVSTVPLQSTAGLNVGDWIHIGNDPEPVQITGISGNSASAVIDTSHGSGTPACLFALPYTQGVIPPGGMGAGASATVATLRFFGDITGNTNGASTAPNLWYVEYVYDSQNNRITRSATPVAQTTKNPAEVLVRNVVPNSVEFRINTNSLGIVTTAKLAFTVRNDVPTGTEYQQTQLSTRVTIPSAMAAAALTYEMQPYQAINRLPPTPANVTTLAAQ